ncbi:hypothetical protein MJO29_012190 [Puccinia striiformis f. sp. tritici]|uniref:hypothetical protein n=1 Tax=Puccinia striiformis f. sp. tritici TaxID=168172 RepID=UPI002007E899|nr:hypothetical protein Pst134EA_022877 [Puccinia striiformis f. sp. tritici]KAH9455409.1 hypothetical protein Pst134EA_022877 [Puccinia striiformis f. sp. tritici]KAI7945802.1 hypothetical protein MJO29_012190 [Puccinia striiformis f. sp. tritici]
MKNRLIRLLQKQSSLIKNNELIKNSINALKDNNSSRISVIGNQENLTKLIQTLNLKDKIKPFQLTRDIPAEALQADLLIIKTEEKQQQLPLHRIHQPVILLVDHAKIHADTPKTNITTLVIDSEHAANAIHEYEHGSGGSHALDQINQSGLTELKKQITKNLENHPNNRMLAALSVSDHFLSLSVDQLLSLTNQLQLASSRLSYYKSKFDTLKKSEASLGQEDASPSIDLSQFPGFFQVFPFGTGSVGCKIWKIIQDTSLSKIEQNIIYGAVKMDSLNERVEDLVHQIINDRTLKTNDLITEVEKNNILRNRVYMKNKGYETIEAIRIYESRKGQLSMDGGLVDILQNKASEILINQSIITITLSGLSLLLSSSIESLAIPGFVLVSSVWFYQNNWRKYCRLSIRDFERWKSNLYLDLITHHHHKINQIFKLSTQAPSPSPNLIGSDNHNIGSKKLEGEEGEQTDLWTSIHSKITDQLSIESPDDHDHTGLTKTKVPIATVLDQIRAEISDIKNQLLVDHQKQQRNLDSSSSSSSSN